MTERVIESIIDQIVEESHQMPSPSEIEKMTEEIVRSSQFIRNPPSIDAHLDVQRRANDHPEIDLPVSSRSDDPKQIQDQTIEAMREMIKRRALRRVRQRDLQNRS